MQRIPVARAVPSKPWTGPERRKAPVAETNPPDVPENYQGPVLLVSPDAIKPDPVHVPTGAPELLQQTQALGVPVVYMQPGPHDNRGDCIDQLKARLPRAQIFFLGGNRGPDVQTALSPDVKSAWLRNTDPFQTDVPEGYHGVITDEYYPEFRTHVLDQLRHAKEGGALPMTTAVYSNPDKLVRAAWRQRLTKTLETGAWALGGLSTIITERIRNLLRDTGPSVDLARHADVAAMTPFALGQTVDDLVLSRLSHDEKSRLLQRVLTAHGTDAGHVDAIRSHVLHPKWLDLALHGKAWRQQQAPVIGDWHGDFERYLDTLTGTQVQPSNAVKVCIDGDEAFPEQLKAIQNAKSFINLTTFAFTSDQFGRQYLAALKEAAQRGVQINMIVDPTGSGLVRDEFAADPHFFDEIKKFKNVQFISTPESPIHDHLNHRKIMTMDNGKGDGGQVGFIGGMNIANEYRMRWHDVHTRIEGPAVEDLNRLFAEQLDRFGGHLSDATRAAMAQPQAPHADGIGVRVVGHVGRRDRTLKLAYLRAINTARNSIDIADPYVSDPEVLGALCARAKEGVKVRLVVPQHNNHNFMKWATEAWYQRMLAAGVEIYEYNGREMAHDKVAVFDGQTTTIGSCNLDSRSLMNNDEANIWSTDRSLAQDVTRRLFDVDVQQSKRITQYQPTALAAALQATVSLVHNWV